LEYFASQKASEKGEVKGHISLANLKSAKKFDEMRFQLDGTSSISAASGMRGGGSLTLLLLSSLVTSGFSVLRFP